MTPAEAERMPATCRGYLRPAAPCRALPRPVVSASSLSGVALAKGIGNDTRRPVTVGRRVSASLAEGSLRTRSGETGMRAAPARAVPPSLYRLRFQAVAIAGGVLWCASGGAAVVAVRLR